MRPNDTTNEIPYGTCACGCGGKTRIALRTSTRRGHVKGEPLRWITGHHWRVVPRSVQSIEARFWKKVSPGAADDCWLWPGKTVNGYGSLTDRGQYIYAHRVSWEIHYGPIPPGMLVCHHCDERYPIGDTTNRRCVNPAHLWLGSAIDNVRDMFHKHRNTKERALGEAHGMAKVTEVAVQEIRRLRAEGASMPALAQQFEVTKSTIYSIVHRRSWRHIP